MNTSTRWAIALLMGATVFRAQTLLFLPSVEFLGGPAPDAWFGPWLSDAMLGVLVPLMVYAFWVRRSIRVWGVLVVYNALGAFDYSHGLLTQALHPMPAEMASPMTVYAGIGVFLACQLVALALLFQCNVIEHFSAAHDVLRRETV
ncbi:MAG: hypothetical protein AAF229_12855 [Pseudomonadota bacterium]